MSSKGEIMSINGDINRVMSNEVAQEKWLLGVNGRADGWGKAMKRPGIRQIPAHYLYINSEG